MKNKLKNIETIFPWKLHLHMMQLERYNIKRTIRWFFAHPLTRNITKKMPLVLTKKASLLLVLGKTYSLAFVAYIFFSKGIALAVLSLAVSWTLLPVVFLSLAMLSLTPKEALGRARTIRKTKDMLDAMDVKVIAITGSYGKTSVKNILYHLTKTSLKVLKTPASYNTIFGINKVVSMELDSSYDYFICEIGAFVEGDIEEMCEMVQPVGGVTIAIAPQHLERFGSIESIKRAKWELPQWVVSSSGEFCFVNTDNSYLKNLLSEKENSKLLSYGIKNPQFGTKDIVFNPKTRKTDFTLLIAGEEFKTSTNLVGLGHVQNIVAASAIASRMGVEPQTIAARAQSIPQIPHRLEVKTLANGFTVLDNAYSSNSDGYKNSLTTLSKLPYKNKILVTPGLVELGVQEAKVHSELGEFANEKATHILGVGDSPRTQNLIKNFTGQADIIPSIFSLWDYLAAKNISCEDSILLFENDLPENYM